MAIRATFNGVNASGYWTGWGVRFPCGEPVTVESDAAIAGVQRHPEFSWQPIELADDFALPEAVTETIEAAAEADKPRKRRRRRK
jgi:hypothetical protein